MHLILFHAFLNSHVLNVIKVPFFNGRYAARFIKRTKMGLIKLIRPISQGESVVAVNKLF